MTVDVPVTGAMLGGNVDYTKAGNYTVTCSYGGITATVVVTVKDGVVIVPSAERIDVRAGTDMRFYDFSADFKVVVNGITFYNATVKVNADIAAKDVDFAVYTYGYNGVVTKAGWSEVFVFDATGKIVRIYDGANAKYFDAENTAGVAGSTLETALTQQNFISLAYASLSEDETLLVLGEYKAVQKCFAI